MSTRAVLSLFAVLIAFSGAACRTVKKPQTPSYTSTLLEAEFQKRWVDKRIAELTVSGMEPTAASAQAEQEFKTQYAYLRISDPPKKR